jgi:hypothetical protein
MGTIYKQYSDLRTADQQLSDYLSNTSVVQQYGCGMRQGALVTGAIVDDDSAFFLC